MDLSSFQCLKCHECCRQPGDVYLRQHEPASIASFLQITEEVFVNDFCDMPVKPRLILKKSSADACIFLRANGCQIYPARPAQCRDFPLKWHTPASLSYCQSLRSAVKTRE